MMMHRGLASVEKIAETFVVITHDEHGKIYVSKDILTIGDDELRKTLEEHGLVYFECQPTLKEIEECNLLATVTSPTVTGDGFVQKLSDLEGVLRHKTYGDVFFNISAFSDAKFGRFQNLKKILRVGDCLNFVAFDQEALTRKFNLRQPSCRFKAERVTLPMMTSSDPVRNRLGFVVNIIPGVGVELFTKPIGRVFLPFDELDDSIKSKLQEGLRIKFADVVHNFSQPRGVRCRWVATRPALDTNALIKQANTLQASAAAKKGGFSSAKPKAPSPLAPISRSCSGSSVRDLEQELEEEIGGYEDDHEQEAQSDAAATRDKPPLPPPPDFANFQVPSRPKMKAPSPKYEEDLVREMEQSMPRVNAVPPFRQSQEDGILISLSPSPPAQADGWGPARSPVVLGARLEQELSQESGLGSAESSGMVDASTQTERELPEEKIMAEVLQDQEIATLFFQKYPDTVHELILASMARR